MKKFKVVQLISRLSVGGAERIAINLAKSQGSSFDYHICVIFRDKNNSEFSAKLKQELETIGISYHESPVFNKKLAILYAPFWLFKQFIKIRPSIVHSHTEIPDISLFLFRKLFNPFFRRVKYFRTIHNSQLWNEWTTLGKAVEVYFSKVKVRNIVISRSVESTYSALLASYKLPPEKTLIYNGIDIISGAKETIFELDSSKINVLFAGRFEKQKGIDILCEVVRSLSENERVHFHLVGDGSMKSYLTDQLRGCSNFTKYNPVSSLSRQLEDFDFLFMPSHFEGLGLLAIESLLSGTPVVANNILGLRECFPEAYPFLVADNDLDRYIEILSGPLDTTDYLVAKSSGPNFVKSNFRCERMRDEYETCYMKSLSCS